MAADWHQLSGRVLETLVNVRERRRALSRDATRYRSTVEGMTALVLMRYFRRELRDGRRRDWPYVRHLILAILLKFKADQGQFALAAVTRGCTVEQLAAAAVTGGVCHYLETGERHDLDGDSISVRDDAATGRQARGRLRAGS